MSDDSSTPSNNELNVDEEEDKEQFQEPPNPEIIEKITEYLVKHLKTVDSEEKGASLIKNAFKNYHNEYVKPANPN
jgi:hypothetical protein